MYPACTKKPLVSITCRYCEPLSDYFRYTSLLPSPQAAIWCRHMPKVCTIGWKYDRACFPHVPVCSDTRCDRCRRVERHLLTEKDRLSCCGLQRYIARKLTEEIEEELDLQNKSEKHVRFSLYQFFSAELRYGARTPLPACVVAYVRELAPGNGRFTGFKHLYCFTCVN